MLYPIQWILSLIFVVQMYLAMIVLAIVFTPFAMINRVYAYAACRTYCRWVRFSARWLVGLRSEIRGDIPTDEVLIASKHQSFFDIIMIVSVVPRPKFIMKKQLSLAPIVGYYAKRIGCVAVDRGKRGQAIKKMVADVKSGSSLPGQLIIFPQGTRVAAGVHMPYKVGTGVLYEQTGQDIVPAATNVGVFWPRHGIYRARGLAVVEFLPRITSGKSIKEVMTELEEVVETASDHLMGEAGFSAPSSKT
ncbi:lysophospholipid acyltransferase family protein [Celeribacter baekdonensis]|uniref:lysophospholipid acyltransferase family protein n=1 Tax=Celeribacter baekdonensis TaxID=875171 RepID=UPI0030DCB2AE|tara:strand:- start:124564 stop:125307 length:744 start_codon:yes stop_codon:yes gene_type:complete